MPEPPALQQISLSLSAEHNAIGPATTTSLARRQRDLITMREDILQRNGGPLPFDIHERHAPFNICISKRFAFQVREIHRLLDIALVDIVERWFSDKEADFPRRMPLEMHEEELLRWIDGPGSSIVPRFGEKYGMWRTDYLIEIGPDGLEKVRICEINARIPFNGFWMVGYHEEASKLLGADQKAFESPNSFDTTREAIFNCFDDSKPLYHVRSKWPGLDSHPFATDYWKRTGQRMVHVKPSELQLHPNPQSSTGYSLFYCPEKLLDGENLLSDDKASREIQQCSLELFQEEISEMDPLLLRQIATCCVNDFRNIFLLHDKRILGVILQELPNLEARQVLTPEEVTNLKASIAETLLPGTDTIRKLLQQSKVDPTQKDLYIIKAVRDASCNGIQIGASVTQDEWLALLERLSDHNLQPSEDAYIIQSLVDQIWYDIVRHEVNVSGLEKFHLIGSHHLINSKFDSFGPWRIGEAIHVGLTGGSKGLVMSCVLRPDLPDLEEMKDDSVTV